MPTLTLPEAAQYLKLKQPETLRRLAKRGDVPGRIVGKEWRFCTHALDQWLAGSFITQGQLHPDTTVVNQLSPPTAFALLPGKNVGDAYKNLLGVNKKG